MGPLNVLLEIWILRRRDKRRAALAQEDREGMKPMSVVPMILLLIIVLYAIYALRPH